MRQTTRSLNMEDRSTVRHHKPSFSLFDVCRRRSIRSEDSPAPAVTARFHERRTALGRRRRVGVPVCLGGPDADPVSNSCEEAVNHKHAAFQQGGRCHAESEARHSRRR